MSSHRNSSTLSRVLSRLRSRRKKKSTTTSTTPPPKPDKANLAHDPRPPLVFAPLPFVLPQHQHTLSTLGWTTLSFPSPAPHPHPHPHPAASAHHTADLSPPEPPPLPPTFPLQQACEQLFSASQAFFAQADAEKQPWQHALRSEEGWSKIAGEKEFITLRTLENCPEVLRQPAERYWRLMGAHLATTLGRISTTLGLPDDDDDDDDDEEEAAGLRKFVGPCATMQTTDARKTATMLRLFRYESGDAKLVAEPHADLGLLSVVVGDVPGLEVWDGAAWFACEKAAQQAGRAGATMLAGRQLERLSNGRYPAGGHRVVSYGPGPGPPTHPATHGSSSSQAQEKQYRYSIVFVLRAHEPVVINASELETEITGTWSERLHGVEAGALYAQIKSRHFNINIGLEEREEQRLRVRKGKG